MRRPTFVTLSATLVATLVACSSSPTTHVGGACDKNHQCDSGQICDRTAPGGEVCLDVDGDVDGDGIPNGMDFCEHMAGGAHDEDGDGIGDECDACPIAAPTGTPDPDGDAVDSPCDPDPRTPGDKIILFNGFNDPVVGASAAWKFQGGEAIVTPAAPDSVEQLVIPLIRATNHMAILAGYKVDSVTAGATESDAGVIGRTNLPMGMSTVECTGTRAGGADGMVLMTDVNQATKTYTDLFNSTTQYRIAEQIDGATANCALIAGSETGAIQAPGSGNVPNEAALIVRGATVRFQYILVIAR